MGILKTLDRLFGNAYDAVESVIEKIDKKVSRLPKTLSQLRRKATVISNDVESIDTADGRFQRTRTSSRENGDQPNQQIISSQKEIESRAKTDSTQHGEDKIPTTERQPSPVHSVDLESDTFNRCNNESAQVDVWESLDFYATTRQETYHSDFARNNVGFHSNVRTESSSDSLFPSKPYDHAFPRYPNEISSPYQHITYQENFTPAKQSDDSSDRPNIAVLRRKCEPEKPATILHQTEAKFSSSNSITEIDVRFNETECETGAEPDFDYRDGKSDWTEGEKNASRELAEESDVSHDEADGEDCVEFDSDWRDGKSAWSEDEEGVNREITEEVSVVVDDEAEEQSSAEPLYDWRDGKSDWIESEEDASREMIEEPHVLHNETDHEAEVAPGFDWRDGKSDWSESEEDPRDKLREIPIGGITFLNSSRTGAYSEADDSAKGQTSSKGGKMKPTSGTAYDTLDGNGRSKDFQKSSDTKKKLISPLSIVAQELVEVADKTERLRPFGKFTPGDWCLWAVPKKRRSHVLVYGCANQTEQISRNGFPYPDEKDQSYWYHGTSFRSALNIIRNGIQLERGQVRQDFSHGDGFYLTPSIASARNWTCNVRKHSPAVVVFKLTFQLQSYKSMDLSVDVHEWQTIVRYNRSGRDVESAPEDDLLEHFEDCDYVFGPINGGKTGSKCLDGNWQKWYPSGFKNTFRQLCIRSEKLARRLSAVANIESVIVYRAGYVPVP